MSYFLAFVGFALLIVLHEAGHFVAAKAVGMRVERFSLFFGPMVVKRQIGETEYGIGVLPFGGYVKITGMSPEEVFETPSIEERAYINQPVWKRVVVILAGPVVNILIAFLLFWVLFIAVGHNVTTPRGSPIASNTIGLIQKGTPAYGKLRVGDRIVSVDGVRSRAGWIHTLIDAHTCPHGARVQGCAASTPATIVVNRDHRLETLHVRPRWNAPAKEMMLGIGFDVKTAPNGIVGSAGRSASWLWYVTKRTVSVIVQIFKPKERRQVHGIVGSYAMATKEISAGWMDGTQIFALISLSLAVINLFPFLPLDGGHVFWAVAEKMRGRRISLRTMERASIVGIGLIAILFVIGLSNDISTLAGSGFRPPG